MNRENKVCKNCGKKFHACGSCGLTYDWELEHCSQKCWVTSKDYIEMRYAFTLLYNFHKKSGLHGEFINWIDDHKVREYGVNDIIMEIEGVE